MPTFNRFNTLTQDIANGNVDFDTDTFKVMLTDVAPVASNSRRSNLTEISAGNGYTAGGASTTVTTSLSTNITAINGTQVVFTASGGAIAQFRYYALYKSTGTAANDPLICWFDHGSEVNLASGESFTIKFNNASPGKIMDIGS